MREVNIDNLSRKKTYEWFNSFSNPTYGVTVRLDVTNLVNHCKIYNESFFIDMLYIVVTALNGIDEFRMRFVNGKPFIYDVCNPAITVMTLGDVFENVRFKYDCSFRDFYLSSKSEIDKAKRQDKLNDNGYNLDNTWDEYYITSLPWFDFTNVSHPIPDDLSSLSVPRICWGRYVMNNDKYEMSFNITVSHVFVDGYHLSKLFDSINLLLNDVDNVFKY